jgi:Dolichyl-phosphate-mannose-protein mannosyltransferase
MKPQALWLALIVFLLIAASRLPFLTAGYGINADAWRVANVARVIAQTGVYEVSRFPGYPVQEIVSSWLWRGGPEALNGLSAVMSVLACVATWQVARRLHCRDPLLLIAALAATPILFVSSVTSKDYVCSLAFSWVALWMAVDNRTVLSGIFLGLAIGCRITAAAMVIPIALIFFGADATGRLRVLAAFLGSAGLVAATCFLPVVQRYGSSFFTFYESHDRPDLSTIILRGTQEVWGTLGLIGLIISIGAIFFAREARRETSITKPSNGMVVPALLSIVVIYVAAYLRLPDQAGYLLPIVPAILFLVARFAPRRVFQLCCLVLIAAPFVEISRSGLHPGVILTDHRDRLRLVSDVSRFVDLAETKLPGTNLVVVGGWEPMIKVLYPEPTTRNHYIYLATGTDLQNATAARWGIAYAGPPIRDFNYRINGIDLDAAGAVDLRRLRPQSAP